jgi:hypothetical protein
MVLIFKKLKMCYRQLSHSFCNLREKEKENYFKDGELEKSRKQETQSGFSSLHCLPLLWVHRRRALCYLSGLLHLCQGSIHKIEEGGEDFYIIL